MIKIIRALNTDICNRATADLARQAHGTLGHSRPRLLREISFLTLTRDLGLALFMTVVTTFCTLHSCKHEHNSEIKIERGVGHQGRREGGGGFETLRLLPL